MAKGFRGTKEGGRLLLIAAAMALAAGLLELAAAAGTRHQQPHSPASFLAGLGIACLCFSALCFLLGRSWFKRAG